MNDNATKIAIAAALDYSRRWSLHEAVDRACDKVEDALRFASPDRGTVMAALQLTIPNPNLD